MDDTYKLDLDQLLSKTRKLSSLEHGLLDSLKYYRQLKELKETYPDRRKDLLRQLEKLDESVDNIDNKIAVVEELIKRMRKQISSLEKESKIEVIKQHILELQNEIAKLERKAKKVY